MIKITVDGQVYDYDTARMLNTEAIALQKCTGMKMKEWFDGLKDGDVFAVTGLVWLLWRRAGREMKFDDVEFNLGGLEFDDDEPEAPVDPPPAAETEAEAAPSI